MEKQTYVGRSQPSGRPGNPSAAGSPAAFRRRVYLDSTIPSYYFDERPQLSSQIAETRRWWDEESSEYDVWISSVTLLEVDRGDHPNKAAIVKLVRRIHVLPEDPAVETIVATYIANKVMPANLEGDASHLAIASFFGFDYLLTWNCNHLANANKQRHIAVVNGRLGLHVPLIVTPPMLVREV